MSAFLATRKTFCSRETGVRAGDDALRRSANDFLHDVDGIRDHEGGVDDADHRLAAEDNGLAGLVNAHRHGKGGYPDKAQELAPDPYGRRAVPATLD